MKKKAECIHELKKNITGYLLDEDVLYIVNEEEEYIFNDLASRFIHELINGQKEIAEMKTFGEFSHQVQAYILRDWLVKNKLINKVYSIDEAPQSKIYDLRRSEKEFNPVNIECHSEKLSGERMICVNIHNYRENGSQKKLDYDWLLEMVTDKLQKNSPSLIHNSKRSLCLEIMGHRLQGIGPKSIKEGANNMLYVPVIFRERKIEIGPIYDIENLKYKKIMDQRQLIRSAPAHILSGCIPFAVPAKIHNDKKTWEKIMEYIIYVIEFEILDLDQIKTSYNMVWSINRDQVYKQKEEDPKESLHGHKIHVIEAIDELCIINESDKQIIKEITGLVGMNSYLGDCINVPILEKLKQTRSQERSEEDDGGHRLVGVKETRAKLYPFVESVTGIIDKIQLTSINGEIFEYRAGRVFGARSKSQRETKNSARSTGQPVRAAGKGRTAYQSQVSCIAEALERYTANFPVLNLPKITTTYNELNGMGLNPNELTLFSDEQYQNRESINKKILGSMHKVPKKFALDEEEDWSPIINLIEPKLSKLIPTSMMGFNYSEIKQQGTKLACSNGLSSGNSITESIVQGIYEVIERDSCAIWWYNKLRVESVEVPISLTEYVMSIKSSLGQMKRTLQLLELPSDFGISVVAAISHRSDGRSICIGLGCHGNHKIAVSRALTEMYQMLIGEKDLLKSENAIDANGGAQRIMKEWLTHENISDHNYLVAKSSIANVKESNKFKFIEEELEWLIEKFKAKGLSIYGSNYTSKEIGFPVTKVFIPGMRHFWPRFAEGRLYSKPVDLGYLEKAKSESEMNAIGFFF